MSSSFDQIRENIFSKYKKDNWEIKTLEEISISIHKGNDVTREQIGTGDYPAIVAGNINGKNLIYIDKFVAFINPDLIQI